jgi:hypothetical protein
VINSEPENKIGLVLTGEDREEENVVREGDQSGTAQFVENAVAVQFKLQFIVHTLNKGIRRYLRESFIMPGNFGFPR